MNEKKKKKKKKKSENLFIYLSENPIRHFINMIGSV